MSGSDKQVPSARAHRQAPWRKDPAIQARLPEVERRHLAGQTNVAIAAHFQVDEGTIRNDLRRLQELWLERVSADQATMRAGTIAKLRHAQRLALNAAAFDEQCERAVLFDIPLVTTNEAGTVVEHRVERDHKGSAQFRGNKAAAIGAYRQAVMDEAKVLGLVVDKAALTDTAGNDLPLAEIAERYARTRGEQTGPDP